MSMDESEREALEFLNNESVREQWRLSDDEREAVLARSRSETPRQSVLHYHSLSMEAFARMKGVLHRQELALKIWDCVVLAGAGMALVGIWLFVIYGQGEWAQTMLAAGLGMTVSGCGARIFNGRKRLNSEFFKAGLGALNLPDAMVDELFEMENAPSGISLRQGREWLSRAMHYEERLIEEIQREMRPAEEDVEDCPQFQFSAGLTAKKSVTL